MVFLAEQRATADKTKRQLEQLHKSGRLLLVAIDEVRATSCAPSALLVHWLAHTC